MCNVLRHTHSRSSVGMPEAAFASAGPRPTGQEHTKRLPTHCNLRCADELHYSSSNHFEFISPISPPSNTRYPFLCIDSLPCPTASKPAFFLRIHWPTRQTEWPTPPSCTPAAMNCVLDAGGGRLAQGHSMLSPSPPPHPDASKALPDRLLPMGATSAPPVHRSIPGATHAASLGRSGATPAVTQATAARPHVIAPPPGSGGAVLPPSRPLFTGAGCGVGGPEVVAGIAVRYTQRPYQDTAVVCLICLRVLGQSQAIRRQYNPIATLSSHT
jgi:hypothetical protein